MSAGQPWLFPGYRGQHTSARQLHQIVRLAAGRARWRLPKRDTRDTLTRDRASSHRRQDPLPMKDVEVAL
jgi:hypothetical protein